ncbi:MAG: transpeptidase family protein [Odoribacteraceae bacterium]|jgi:cell division protein FtsI (penicillin-binding protein 3)|nr:transpeptidase family protein [Odoribacteraceae bacterium]
MIIIYVLLIGVSLPVIIGKILYIQVWEGEYWKQRDPVERMGKKEMMPARGNICAEDGRVLAFSIPFYSLHFDPFMSKDTLFQKKVDSLALMLSSLFGDALPASYRQRLWNARFGAKPNHYLRLGPRNVTHSELQEVKKFPLLRPPKEQERGSESGLITEERPIRKTPYGALAQRTIGYLRQDDTMLRGWVGLEEAYEQELRGKPGLKKVEMLSGRKVWRTIEEPVRGYDVITTIDIDYQYIVHEALLAQLERYKAHSGVAVLMEVKTGDIKAITNLLQGDEGYEEELNIAIRDLFEPGSVFKAATMLALLEDGYVHPEDTVDLDSGVYRYHGQQLKEDKRGYIGKVTVQRIFERSLNGISKLLVKHYDNQRKRFADRLYAMQLNKKLDVEIAGEAPPKIKYPTNKEWSGNTLPWMSIGYEVQMTPLQVLAFYNTLANDGKRMKPRFVKEIRNGDEVVRHIPVEVMDRSICSRSTLAHLRRMMEGVVERGTASNLRGSSYGIAGKTGTAGIASGRQGYGGVKRYLASFVGYFPAKEPLYSCIVMVKDPAPDKGYHGNVVSGSVFREISDKVYALASVKHGRSVEQESDRLPVSKNGYRDDFLTLYDALAIPVKEEKRAEWVLTTRVEGEIVLRPHAVDSVVPNVKGMGLRDALYLLENRGLCVGASGSGMVTSQTIDPGSRVSRGSYIHIELR